ncbi:BTB/POZ protein [Xylariaceae sp. FL0255]|nr:BTB/POZ protein [Xylariaceae sp. FL0255]
MSATTAAISFRDEDAMLFESGENLSDVTIICSGTEWKLHKTILTTRSDWFKKALTGSFKEAISNVVRIEEKDPEALGWMLRWIYTGELNGSCFEKDDTKYRALTRLHQHADFFCLDKLVNVCEHQLKRCLREKAVWIQERFADVGAEKRHELCTDEDLKGFMDGVAETVVPSQHRLRDLYLRLLPHCFYWIVMDKTFTKLGCQMPKFWDEVKARVFEAQHYGHIGPIASPTSCYFCKGTSRDYNLEWSAIRVDSDRVYGACNLCWPRDFGEVIEPTDVPTHHQPPEDGSESPTTASAGWGSGWW